MKCLFITNTDRMTLLFFVPHIKLLIQMGYEVTIAAPITNRNRFSEQLPNVHLHDIPFARNLNPVRNLNAFLSLKKLLKVEDYQLIHVHTPLASFLTRLAIEKEQPLIYTAHGFHFHGEGSKISNQLFFLAEKLAASKTTKLIVINEEDLQNAEKIFPHDKIRLINGVGINASLFKPQKYSKSDRNKIRQKLGIKQNTIVMTHLAEFNGNKRQIDIIHSVEKLREMHQNFVVLLIGEGPMRKEMMNEISERGLIDYIRCLGYRLDVVDILSITDIGLLVSLREGLPKSIMEMMAMEIPVVATTIRGNQDLITDGENGLLIPTKSPDELWKACYNLMQNDELRREMGAKGRRKILSTYDLPIIMRELKAVYESIESSDVRDKNVLFDGKEVKDSPLRQIL